MISILQDYEIENLRYAGSVLKKVQVALRDKLKPGMTPKKLNSIAHKIITKHNCQPNFLGYMGFPSTICVSVNNVLVHGIPNKRLFCEGDIVSIDAGCKYKSIHVDAAFTEIIGKPNTEQDEALVIAAQTAFQKAVTILKSGVRVGTIGHVIETYVSAQGFFLPRDYCGHGIGHKLHLPPAIFNYGQSNKGFALKPNMAICIEPMLQIGTDKTRVLSDKWSVVSDNGLNTAHFEHTILITKNGYEVIV